MPEPDPGYRRSRSAPVCWPLLPALVPDITAVADRLILERSCLSRARDLCLGSTLASSLGSSAQHLPRRRARDLPDLRRARLRRKAPFAQGAPWCWPHPAVLLLNRVSREVVKVLAAPEFQECREVLAFLALPIALRLSPSPPASLDVDPQDAAAPVIPWPVRRPAWPGTSSWCPSSDLRCGGHGGAGGGDHAVMYRLGPGFAGDSRRCAAPLPRRATGFGLSRIDTPLRP